MGVQAAGRPLPPRAAEHPRLLQHQVLPAEDRGPAPQAILLTHHEGTELTAAFPPGFL